jgi:AbrB family looped-hinge helix DNA binding protein
MTTMTSKGQVTIPKRMREALGLKPGSKVAFEYQGNGKALIRREGKPPVSRFAKLRGSLKSDLTTDQIMAMTRGED